MSIPVLLLGGQENALSLVRSLARRGVPVRVAATGACHALRSRHLAGGYRVPAGTDQRRFWADLLLGGGAPELEGAVVLPCSDPAIEFMADHAADLAPRYRLDDHLPDQRRALLDKARTLDLARSVGVPAPRYWGVASDAEVEAVGEACSFPVAVKPVLSHRFQAVFAEKLLVARDLDGLREGVNRARARGVEVIVTEWIPGPDTALSSYYTYVDGGGRSLFHFTKRILRRSPPGWGRASYHETAWLPETAEVARRFLDGIGFRGLANVEFKRDPRDGTLKIIECNARFTAAQEILVRAGLDIGWLIYRHLIGRPVPAPAGYAEGVRLWHPSEDFDAFRDLRARGELGFLEWVRSVLHPTCFAYFAPDDPLPAVSKGWHTLRRRVGGRLRPGPGAP